MKTKSAKKTNLLRAEGGYFTIETQINGQKEQWRVKPHEFLLDALRREGYKGAKKGCDTGDCGSCTVLVDGEPMLSCLLLAVQAHGRSITTIEGLGSPNHPHPIQEAFVKAGAVQCGFCIPGMILAAKSLLDKNPEPADSDIKYALDGNLCRCTGYVKQIEAVRMAADMVKTASKKRAGVR